VDSSLVRLGAELYCLTVYQPLLPPYLATLAAHFVPLCLSGSFSATFYPSLVGSSLVRLGADLDCLPSFQLGFRLWLASLVIAWFSHSFFHILLDFSFFGFIPKLDAFPS